MDIDYHCKQYVKAYRSTECFVGWLEKLGYLNKSVQNICDMACGGGANIAYMGNRFKSSFFTGIDLSDELIEYGNRRLEGRNNCRLYQGDWYNLDKKWIGKFNGIISFQTLSWLPEYEKALNILAMLNPEWIAISSLFYEGDIEYIIKIKGYYRPSANKEYEEAYYNIYSLVRIEKCFKQLGYSQFNYVPFDIDLDLPKPESLDIGTYTIKTEGEKRIQVSGALMMPWHFIVASK